MFLDRYVPIPREDITEMLCGLRLGDAYCDLGSGDGRLLVAAKTMGAGSVTGYEMNDELVAKVCDIIQGVLVVASDFMKIDWGRFDYLTFFGDECWSDLVTAKFKAETRSGSRLKLYQKELLVQP